jgi:hypothetical protein
MKSFLCDQNNNTLAKIASGTKERGLANETRATSEDLKKSLNPPFGSHCLAAAIGAAGADSGG